MNILSPYLPQVGGGSQIAYSEGGALYALGLINAGCCSGQPVEDYLRETMKTSQGELVQHGAALGLGIAGMSGRSSDSYNSLKETLFTWVCRSNLRRGDVGICQRDTPQEDHLRSSHEVCIHLLWSTRGS